MPEEPDPMPEELIAQSDNRSPSRPAPAPPFSKRMRGLMNDRPQDDAKAVAPPKGKDEIVDWIAVELYNLASMLVGEGEQSVRLVEATVTQAEVSVCQERNMAQQQKSRRALCTAALELLAESSPAAAGHYLHR
jgi:hypothetical protein